MSTVSFLKAAVLFVFAYVSLLHPFPFARIPTIPNSHNGQDTQAYTDVGGVIETDTVWKAEYSPYRLVADTKIASEVTLEVEPGVVIEGENNNLQILGRLVITGHVDQPVIIRDVHVTAPETNLPEQPYEILMQFTQMSSGSLLPPGYHGHGIINIFNSSFTNIDTPILLYYPKASSTLQRNIFNHIGGLSVGVSDGVTVSVINNLFVNWTGILEDGVVIENWASLGNSLVKLENNSFLGVQPAVAIPITNSGANVSAVNNFWATTDPQVIKDRILDRNDNSERYAEIPYDPYLLSSHPDTPSLPTLDQTVEPTVMETDAEVFTPTVELTQTHTSTTVAPTFTVPVTPTTTRTAVPTATSTVTATLISSPTHTSTLTPSPTVKTVTSTVTATTTATPSVPPQPTERSSDGRFIALPIIFRPENTPTPTPTPTATNTLQPTPQPTEQQYPTPQPPSPTPQPGKPVEVLSNYSIYVDSIDYLHVVGEVINRKSEAIELVKITGNFFSASKFIDTDFTYTMLDVIPPNEKACFELMFPYDPTFSYVQFEEPTYWTADYPPVLTLLQTNASYDSYFGWYEINGLVRNDTGSPIEFVKPVGTLYNSSGYVIGCDYSFVNSTDLSPGQTSSFDLTFFGRDYSDVATYRVQVDGNWP